MFHRIVYETHEAIVRTGAGFKFWAPLETPQHPFVLKLRQPVSNRREAAALKVLISGETRQCLGPLVKYRRLQLVFCPLSQWVALLALSYRRAPLRASHSLQRALQKALKRQGIVDGAELVDLVRRYFFLGDAQVLLAELRNAQSAFRILLTKFGNGSFPSAT